MDTNSVVSLARSLMTEHGVGYLQFGFHHYPTRPGVVGRAHTADICDCEYEHVCAFNVTQVYSKITLDVYWVSILPEFKIRETLLHEIAHALTPIKPFMNPHDGTWKKKCIELGIEPVAKFKWHTSPKTMTEMLDKVVTHTPN